MKRDDDSVIMYRKSFTMAGNPETFRNRWVSLKDFRERMLNAYQHYVTINDFDRAGKLLQGFRPMFSGLRTIELTAQTHRQWATALSKQAELLSESEAYPLRRKSALHMRKAGYTYAKLARFRAASREFPEDIWNAADCLLQGNDYVNAIKMLNEYLKNEHRRLRPQALVGIGKAHLALGNIDASLESLLECIKFHGSDAAIYEARLWCGKAYLEKGELDQAEKLLRDNLNGGTLTPASHEWRDSLFAMGHLLHAAGRHEEAITRLEEAVARYPDTPQSLEGLYLIAEAYREAAQAPQERLRNATIESVKIAQRKQIRRLLDGARDYYLRVQEKLNRRAESASLTEMEPAMLRNCYFSIGSVFFDLGRYEDAIKAYSNASTRYQNEPMVLEAFMQIANCHRRLNRPLEARGALEQAKVVWKRLDPEMHFTSTTNYDRDEWFELLDRLSKW
jgi:tetratricopeptide (TPR) repeat protein